MRTFILFSGGMDSLVTLGIARQNEHREITLVYIDYGQAVAKREVPAMEYFADHYQVPGLVLELKEYAELCNLPPWVTSGKALDHTITREEIATNSVRTRNL